MLLKTGGCDASIFMKKLLSEDDLFLPQVPCSTANVTVHSSATDMRPNYRGRAFLKTLFDQVFI